MRYICFIRKNLLLTALLLFAFNLLCAQQTTTDFTFINKYKYVYVETVVKSDYLIYGKIREKTKTAAKFKTKLEKFLRHLGVPVVTNKDSIPQGTPEDQVLKIAVQSTYNNSPGLHLVKQLTAYSSNGNIISGNKNEKSVMTLRLYSAKVYLKMFKGCNSPLKKYKYNYAP